MELRQYQKDAIAAVAENLQLGIRHQLLVLATGTGKTVIAAQLPSIIKGKLLFVAHRNELLTQAREKIQLWNPALKIGLEKAENHADPDCDVVVACNASIGRKGSTRMDSFWQDISTIVIDEVHHAVADSYLNILKDSGALLPDSTKVVIGLTATPKRHDRKRTGQTGLLDDEDTISLKSIFQKVVYAYPLRKAIKDGFLVSLRGFRIGTQTDLSEVKTVAGDFAVDQLSTAVNTPERNLQIVKAWKENAHNRQTACFTVNIQHAKDLAEAFLHNGVMATPIWGEDEQRAQKLAWHDSGKTTVLCNCALLTEGWDSPSVSCIVLARPTRSGSLYTQMVGRGTRLHPGKEDCVILDVCDLYKKCSLVTLPSLLGLNPLLDLHGGSIIEAAETLEAAQDKYPGVDFTNLTDITKVKAFIESIDLFAQPYSEEVIACSKLTWVASGDDYVISIPEKQELKGLYAQHLHEKLWVKQNQLEEWVLSITSVSTDKELGVYNTLKEALESGDEVLTRCRSSRVKLMLREPEWKDNPATEPQRKLLRSLSKKRPVLYCLCPGQKAAGFACPTCRLKTGITMGQASTAINLLRAQKGK